MVVRLALLAALFMVSSISGAPNAKDGSFKLTILHNNDMHARFEQTGIYSDKCSKADADANLCFGGFARVAHEVRRYRALAKNGQIPQVLYLNAGDTYTGTPWFSIFKDEIASAFLKMLEPDAISLGNHEFDEGADNLAKFLTEVNFPVLAANLDLENEPILKVPNLVPSKVFEIEGRKVGVIGYLTPETKDVAVGNNVEFIEETVALNQEAAKLKAEGVNIIIALGHSGLDKDKQIAADCPEIDLIIGGHSHSFLYSGQVPSIESAEGDYPVMVTQASGKKVPVVQAYAYTKYLGKLNVEFDDEGNLIHIDGTPILLDGSIVRDADVLTLLDVYRPNITALQEVVGTTKVLLDGNCRQFECNLGNFIADAFVDWRALNYQSPDYWTDASIGFVQGGGVRSSINHKSNNGEITKEDAQTVMPFASVMEIVEINGKDLLEALEHSVHRYEDGAFGEFLQVSGVQVEYDISKPIGQRVLHAKVLCAQCSLPELQDIEEAKLYRIVMQDFLADGGDGYTMFKGKSVEKFPDLDLDVFIQHIKRKTPIHPSVEWRVTVHIKTPVVEPSEDVLGTTLVMLDSNCQQHECNFGNFITDAIVDWHALKHEHDEFWTDASIALIQGSRIKASIDSKVKNGQITKVDVDRVFSPAYFNINLVTLTGEELKKMLEHSVSDHEVTNNVHFLQMSGLQVHYDLNHPFGERVTDVKVLCSDCSVPTLEPLDVTKQYKVLMQSVLASGADGYGNVLGVKLLEDLEESDANVFIEYLKKKSPVHPAVEWRITVTEKNQEPTAPPTLGPSVPPTNGPTNVPPTIEPEPTTLAGSSLTNSVVLIFLMSLLSLTIIRR